ncbi:CHC2 zinc finger [Nitrosomonas marina]|uniref:CHC2 zinc finger n=1 Tax=Nitrosomonas marina TaxID=917 RepID=A0A1I0D6Q0_9PROT|nr:CHC2 zinc finger domain-containing protein [Nitrosomonas marina]SET27912.1 CHC2 zinc finger [Nitrosomonas marina]
MRAASVIGQTHKSKSHTINTKRGLDYLLSQLRKVKSCGQDRFIACCPAHHDKNPSLAIRTNGGVILLKCFAGCSTFEIVSSIGMVLAELFPESNEFRKPLKNPFPAVDVLRCIKREVMIITVTAIRIVNGEKIEKSELDRLILACSLIEVAYD